MTEDQLEQEALGWLTDVGYAHHFGPDIAYDGVDPQRSDYRQVVLAGRLRKAIARLNPSVPQAAREDALQQVMDLGIPALLSANRAFHKLLVGGVPVQYQQDGDTRGDFVRLIDWADVVAIGSGLGTKKTARKILKETIAYTKKPCVIDADGLNILSEHMDYLCGADCEHFIFTPHMKEFERISGLKIAEVKKDRIAALRTFVKEYDVTCVLKDSRTTIAKPRERVAVNLSGCAAMAKAGSGDVLAGIIASYLAQGLSEWEAALLGVYIHGRAGEIIEKEQGAYSLLARELAQKAGTAMTIQEEN